MAIDARAADESDDPRLIVGVLGSPFGPIHLAVGGQGVVGVELRTTTEAFRSVLARRRVDADLRERRGAPGNLGRAFDVAARELREYAAGRRTRFDLAIDLRGRSLWDRRVLEGVRTIAYGRATSYGRLAAMIGARGAARAVGGAVGRNPIGLIVPCHRVLAGDGSLGGYGGAWFGDRDELLALKRSLLGHEGIALPATRLVGP